MECDFSGWATKAGLKCSDGRTIMPNAFQHQDRQQVPLVWQHGHRDPMNVLGHAILENRGDEGVYAYCFLNDSEKAKHAAKLVEHKDINSFSIWANDLIERSKRVLHGAIREVSLVLSGANPGALIENVTIRHSDDDDEVLEDEAIIYTGLVIEHSTKHEVEVEEETKEETKTEETEVVQHAEGDDDELTVQDVYESMSDEQKQVLHYMVGAALEEAGSASHGNVVDDDQEKDQTDLEKGKEMKHHNVFEDQGGESTQNVLSHDDMQSIMDMARRTGSLKHAVEEYAISHGINDIETLFPDAKAVTNVPEWVSRRTEWVGDFLGAVRKSPFSRIKTLSADLTFEEARAKGYVKGTLKREEFFGVAARTTEPTTIYKKQSIDRDDVIDITDFDVIAWLKAEMRLMLDEELARAALIGDGRDIASEDKIDEQRIRPIAKDHELYTTTINVNVGDANSSMAEVSDAILMNRYRLKGTGSPTFYTTDYWLARFLTARDNDGKRLWKNIDELATELRVRAVIPVEVMMEDPSMVGILVNPSDYVLGATRGGEVNMFDDFDIDYNKQKYLIETRCSGALVKVKAAMVVIAQPGEDELVVAAVPTFDGEEVTIIDTANVVYRNAETNAVINAAGSPYAVAEGDSLTVKAEPAAGYYFATSDDDEWTFTNTV